MGKVYTEDEQAVYDMEQVAQRIVRSLDEMRGGVKDDFKVVGSELARKRCKLLQELFEKVDKRLEELVEELAREHG